MAKKILKGVGKLAGGVVGSVIGGKLLGGKKKKSAAPTGGPIVMPLPDDEAVKRARKAAIAKQIGRGGRSSTILSDGDSLGGGL